MKRLPCCAAAALLALGIGAVAPAAAQLPPLALPEASPAAAASQTIGLTAITVSYHRPGVNERTVWGELVPYDMVWRAGANENTTISFSTPVKIQGQELAAGTYGLHMLPTKGQWTVIFSNQADAWGSFSYDQQEDALRVAATPRPADFQERLSYRFDDPEESAVELVMAWEKLEIPVRIEIDRTATVLADLRQQLRGLPRFGWQGWNQAANWSLRNSGDLAEALGWVDKSLEQATNFTNLRTKAAILEKQGDAAQAKALRDRALTLANEADVNTLGYQQLGSNEVDAAIATFKKNVADYPQSWNTYDSLAEAYATKGDTKQAISNYEKARKMVRDETNQKRIDGLLQGLRARG